MPTDPPTLPDQSGTAGTFNFQLHPAFWFGMAMCDDESAPNPGGSPLAGPNVACTPDSDANIFTGLTPTNQGGTNYIGQHPGVAFMEMQFYPPGWVSWPDGLSCHATLWCAALNIDSFNENLNTSTLNNAACVSGVAGIEPVNFAFITRSGVADTPADPRNFNHFTPNLANDLLMNSGDTLLVDLHDTPAGFQVVITDVTSGQTGSMTASAANGFAHVKFEPTATTCNADVGAFHPAYSTSSEATRVPWAAHSYNVAFSDEIGHFEYCDKVSPGSGKCTAASASDPAGPDSDDNFCFPARDSLRIQISGCQGTDTDFDGAAYQHTWPGSLSDQARDQRVNPRSILFSSPLFNRSQNYSRVAFEADLPRIEAADFGGNCNRTTGANCVNPPPGANFYPFYSTRQDTPSRCLWQLGGGFIPGTVNTFGGNSTAEFGPLLQLQYPSTTGVVSRFQDFRDVVATNPCRAQPGG